ncbi:MAG: hypothetical protein K8S27_00600 [Candidatus Omnitrophica bacterium]|nr:hypothetical protein [Candidatus Omnitrophota bacterium]
MKKVFMLLMIASLFIAMPLYAETEKEKALNIGKEKILKPGHVEKKIIRILGDNDWLDTGFVLKPKDRVVIKATGEVFFSNGTGDSGVDPDGYIRDHYASDYSGDNAHCGDPIEIKHCGHAALIGKDAQGTFLLGKEKTISGKKGKFYIGINDCSFKEEYYNTGEFSVIISVFRGK